MNSTLLKLKRKAAGYTQEDMSKIFSFTRQAYQQKESSKINFKMSEIKKLKELFNLTNDEIYEIFID